MTKILSLLSTAILLTQASLQASTLFLGPPNQTVGKGETFTVSVRMNSGDEPVNSVQAVLSFPSDKLKAVSIDSSASSFGIKAEEKIGKGMIKIVRGTIKPVSGDQLVSSITFKAV